MTDDASLVRLTLPLVWCDDYLSITHKLMSPATNTVHIACTANHGWAVQILLLGPPCAALLTIIRGENIQGVYTVTIVIPASFDIIVLITPLFSHCKCVEMLRDCD